jgi:hypothetical protein
MKKRTQQLSNTSPLTYLNLIGKEAAKHRRAQKVTVGLEKLESILRSSLHENQAGKDVISHELDEKMELSERLLNHLLSLQPSNKLKKNLTQVVNTLQHAEDESKMAEEENITQWLAQLQLLNGIPLKYIVPLHALLPNEAIRFFKLDNNWLKHLSQGALSLGSNDTEADTLHDSSLFNWYLQKSNIQAHTAADKKFRGHLKRHFSEVQKYKLLLNKLSALITNEPELSISGFMMRSEFVQRYPGVQLLAKNKEGVECTLLRSDILGNNLKICLFKGIIKDIEFYENPENLACTVQNLEKYKIKFREENLGVINIKGLVSNLSNGKTPFDSAMLAKELFCKKESFTYKIQE